MIDQFELKKDVTKQNEGNFGKYNVRVNDLKRGFFNIRYPSGAVIRPFPKQLISTTLRNIIVQIIYEKKFSEEEYETLDDSEKKLFDDLITFAKLDKCENIKYFKHKRYNDEERNADIKRFNILRGELVAGNDSKEIVKELKKLLYKLLDQKVIQMRDYNHLIHRLLLLD